MFVDDVNALVDAKWVANEKSYEKCELPGKNMERASGRFRMLLTVDAVRKKYAYRYIDIYMYMTVYV